MAPQKRGRLKFAESVTVYSGAKFQFSSTTFKSLSLILGSLGFCTVSGNISRSL